jgi:microcystin-dependent protein
VRLGSLAGRGTVGGVGGADTHTILISQVQAHNHSGLTGRIDRSLDHTHGYSQSVGGNVGVQTSGGGVFYGGLIAANTGGSSGGSMDHLHAIGYDGGSQPHNNLQPLLVKNKILVVE